VRARLQRCLLEGAHESAVDLEAYLDLIENDAPTFQRLLDRVTVQHSAFFRDPAQFEALVEILRREPAGPVAIWSAACGNGQEPYSLAMILAESGHPSWTVYATDVSSRALTRTRAGRYTPAELKAVSEDRLRRHFSSVPGGMQVAGSLREHVQVLHHNLATSPPPMPVGLCSIVFCRNVLIYFDQNQVATTIQRLAAWMPPAGHLFLGFSESLWELSSGFDLVRVAGAFIYQRSPAKALPRLAAEPRPASRPVPVVAGRAPDPREPIAAGERAFAAGDSKLAVLCFRRATYLEPDQPVGYFQLGSALELAGDRREAHRAFTAAAAALARSGTLRDVAGLEGYTKAALGQAIAAKLEAL